MKCKFKLWGEDSLRLKLLCGLATILFPITIFIYFCAQNINELVIWAVIVSGLFLLMIATVGYLFSLIVFRRAFPAFVFSMICWLGCYLEPMCIKFMAYTFPSIVRGRLSIITIIILFFSWVVTKILRNVHNEIKWITFFLVSISIVFVINIGTLLGAFLQEHAARNAQIPIKHEFFVSMETKSPDIYWIHADGMLSVEAVKKYYGDSQENFLSALVERGFFINPEAQFEAAHTTACAIPILMNPYSYDNWIKEFTVSHEKTMNELQGLNRYYLRIMRKNNEFQNAFVSKGYKNNLIGPYGFYFPAVGGEMWLVNSQPGAPTERDIKILSYSQLYDREAIINITDHLMMNDYFSLLSKLLIQVSTEGEQQESILVNAEVDPLFSIGFVNALRDVLSKNYSSPSLTIVHDLMPHCPFIYDSNGMITKGIKNMNPLDYYPQHIWSSKILISMVDVILEANPEAVIVIQSDHGMNARNMAESFKTAFGEDADAIELWNSVMSAIRVPEKYRTGEEHYAMENPLNISRYLVNSFVGKNYEYLPDAH